MLVKSWGVTEYPLNSSHTGYIPRQNIVLNNDAYSNMTNMLVTLDTFQDGILLSNDNTNQISLPCLKHGIHSKMIYYY